MSDTPAFDAASPSSQFDRLDLRTDRSEESMARIITEAPVPDDERTEGEYRTARRAGAGPFFVIVNAGSGSGGQRRESLVRQALEQAGLDAHVVVFDRSGRVEEVIERTVELARDAGGTLVVAGGDGTINSSLTLLLERDLPLGILPCGTFNYVARQFGIPLDLGAAVENLIQGAVTEVPVGEVNGRPFLVNASLGLYPRLLEDREQAKRTYGRNRFNAMVLSASSLLARRARTFGLEVRRAVRDDRPLGAPHQLDVSTLFIGNNTLQLQRVGIEYEPSELTAIVLRQPTALRLLELGLRAAVGSLGEAKDILTFPFEQLVATERPHKAKGVKIALDGEVMHMQGPLTFRRAEKSLRLIAPPPSPDEEKEGMAERH